MKNIFATICIAICALALSACEKKEIVADTLTVTPEKALLFNAEENTPITITINTNAASWEYAAPEWVIATHNDSTLVVNATDNEGEMRKGIIRITAGEAEAVELPISQRALRPIKQIVYIEVNDCNPLNLLEYNLIDDTPFFDAVILFAANINYDSENDKVYVHANANVQALLDESDIYLQPLRERGIKVYLGILGNHDAAGVAQLSAWGAQQWAQEVAKLCKTYKLDGVNLDDEYSKKPILTNHWFTMHSAKAGARLAYELKIALQEHCSWPTEVSVYEYGALYNLPAVTIDGVTHNQSEFIDMVLADYGGRVIPYGDLTYAQCSGASIQLAYGNSLTEKAAQSALDKGYGWCMWFAFDPSGTGGTKNNLEHSMQQFNVAAKVFYNSTLKQPSLQYNKIGEGIYDPTPHVISQPSLGSLL